MMQQNKRRFKPNRSRVHNDSEANNLEREKSAYGILPAPGILESYEEISPGSVSKILELVKKEQKHRQFMEAMNVRLNSLALMVGQLIAGIFALAILYFTAHFLISGAVVSAIVIAFFGFSFLLLVIRRSRNRDFKRPNRG
jgi:uncharacterized membrane protein